jgi:hypothetical protein
MLSPSGCGNLIADGLLPPIGDGVSELAAFTDIGSEMPFLSERVTMSAGMVCNCSSVPHKRARRPASVKVDTASDGHFPVQSKHAGPLLRGRHGLLHHRALWLGQEVHRPD